MTTADRLSPEDRVLLRGDRDPRRRTTVGGLAVLTGPVDHALVVERLDRATRAHPELRERVVEPALATTEPRWVVDPDFDLTRHVRRIALARPGRRTDLIALVDRLVEAPFDPASPLWTVTVVDGVDRGAAIITTASPVLRVLGSPVDLLDIVLDDSLDGQPLAAVPVPTDLEPLDLAREGLHELPTRAAALALGGVQEVAGLAVRAVVDPEGALAQVRALVAPPAPPAQGSPLLAGRGTGRRLLTFAFSLPTGGATPLRNVDALHLEAVRAGVLDYLAESGLPATSLDITAASHPALLRRALAPRQDPVETWGRLLPLLPDGIVDATVRPARCADVAVSVVAGDLDGGVGRARVSERYAVGPVPGNALTSVAYAAPGRVFVAVRYDTAAIRDPDLLESSLRDALGTAFPAAAAKPPARRPRTAGA